MSPKNPQRPCGPLTADTSDFTYYTGRLYTIFPVEGRYRRLWSAMRSVGPIKDCRWDPHPEPRADHRGVGVLYAATEMTTAFGEVFQRQRSITVSRQRAIAGWYPQRPLKLLDLTVAPDPNSSRKSWALRMGASASLDSAPKNTCRAWARAIASTWPDLDGLFVRSTVTGIPMVVLFTPAKDSFPASPQFARPLDFGPLAPVIVKTAKALGWPVR